LVGTEDALLVSPYKRLGPMCTWDLQSSLQLIIVFGCFMCNISNG
jgi:hypothetical protein